MSTSALKNILSVNPPTERKEQLTPRYLGEEPQAFDQQKNLEAFEPNHRAPQSRVCHHENSPALSGNSKGTK